MPKVSSVWLTVKGDTQEYGIFYNKTEKFYIKDFPADVKRIMNSAETVSVDDAGKKFETEQELVEHYKSLLERYHTMISKTRKVIVYHLSAPTEFCDLPEISREIKDKFGYAGQAENCFGFTIEYKVLLEHVGDGTAYFIIRENGEMGYRESIAEKQSIIIDYTPEREAFLQQLQSRMKEMFLKVVSVMMDEQKFIEVAHSNIKLLG